MKSIWVPLSGQIAQQRKVETLANNIANANTAGFKKDQLVFKEHLTALERSGDEIIDLPRGEWSPEDFYRTSGAEHAFVKIDGSYTIHKQGELKPTQSAFDMGLHGKGFFEVLTPSGVKYTRNGSFTLNNNSELVTSQGFKVLDASDPESPTPIVIPQNEKFSVSKEGEIFTKNGVVGKISVVEFKDIHALKKQGSLLFLNNQAKNILRESIKTSVNQGFIEGSNVNAISEMSELIQAHRQFENIQKAIKTYDSMSGNISNDIGKF